MTYPTANRVYFFGMPGRFSCTVLKTLYEQDIHVDQIFCAGPAPAESIIRALPVTSPQQSESLSDLAEKLAIPIQYIRRKEDLWSSEHSQSKRPDFLLVACFPFRLPNHILQWPRKACLNIHPSLLPKYRGPDPIFWQLYHDEQHTGVSLHLMTHELDSGPIVMQQAAAYGDGSQRHQIESTLASLGAKLFAALLKTSTPVDKLLRKQNQEEASYFPAATQEDYYLHPQWCARQAFNFMRGTCPPDKQFRIKINNNILILSDCIDYESEGQIQNSYVKNNEDLYIQFSPGILHARYTSNHK
jgi:methionyl-tRNA formyltransferase